MAKKGLGKGLGAIFGEDVVKENKEETEKKAKAKAEAKAAEAEKGERFQFFRHGYFVADAKLHEKDAPVFNEIVGLKSSWK